MSGLVACKPPLHGGLSQTNQWHTYRRRLNLVCRKWGTGRTGQRWCSPSRGTRVCHFGSRTGLSETRAGLSEKRKENFKSNTTNVFDRFKPRFRQLLRPRSITIESGVCFIRRKMYSVLGFKLSENVQSSSNHMAPCSVDLASYQRKRSDRAGMTPNAFTLLQVRQTRRTRSWYSEAATIVKNDQNHLLCWSAPHGWGGGVCLKTFLSWAMFANFASEWVNRQFPSILNF